MYGLDSHTFLEFVTSFLKKKKIIRFERFWPTFDWGQPNYLGMNICIFMYIFVIFVTNLSCLIYVLTLTNFLIRNTRFCVFCDRHSRLIFVLTVTNFLIHFKHYYVFVTCLYFNDESRSCNMPICLYNLRPLVICVLSRVCHEMIACDILTMWYKSMYNHQILWSGC